MEISLNELVTLQSALVNVKMFVFGERKIDQDKLAILVDEAYAVAMKKIDSLEQPFFT
ncbi:MAG TPA: hypothetical protein VJS91_03915 [Nitrososphaeraceae archaeon]|nr:hypothetical protein [Nitrososphaeraceae archaeon]